ncbi:MAG: TMEM14 family protein [Leptolyngbyaceae cyanobacterium]
MSPAAIMTLIYAVLSIVGGVIGYQQAGSKASMISGIATGVLLIVAGIAILQAQTWGGVLAIAVTLLLVIVFCVRLLKTRRFFPAGLMIAVGIGTLIALFQSGV